MLCEIRGGAWTCLSAKERVNLRKLFNQSSRFVSCWKCRIHSWNKMLQLLSRYSKEKTQPQVEKQGLNLLTPFESRLASDRVGKGEHIFAAKLCTSFLFSCAGRLRELRTRRNKLCCSCSSPCSRGNSSHLGQPGAADESQTRTGPSSGSPRPPHNNSADWLASSTQ